MNIKRTMMIKEYLEKNGDTEQFYEMCLKTVSIELKELVGESFPEELKNVYRQMNTSAKKAFYVESDAEKKLLVYLAIALAYSRWYVDKAVIGMFLDENSFIDMKQYILLLRNLGIRTEVLATQSEYSGVRVLLINERDTCPPDITLGTRIIIGDECLRFEELEKREIPPLDIVPILNSSLPLVLEYDEKYDKTDINQLQALCENEDVVALYELASRYRCGVDGVEQDEEKAANLYYNVLKVQRNACAARYIGLAYLHEVFGKKYQLNAKEWLELASDWGDGGASEELGRLYAKGQTVVADTDMAIEFYNKALVQGEKHAFYNLGVCHKIREEYDKATECLEQAIKQAKVYYSYIVLGEFYEEGLGVPQDGEKAFEMYRLAYEHDIPDGAYYMARMLWYGELISEDNALAYKLFVEALESGIEEANYFLGLLHCLNENENPVVEKDICRALQYLDAVPEHMTEMAYEKKGFILVRENRIEEAIECYQVAADLGSREALERLQKLQEPKKKAMEHIENANIEQLLQDYEQGVDAAGWFIAEAYRSGTRGAEVDYNKAIDFYQKLMKVEGFEQEAVFALTLMSLNEEGLTRDLKKCITNLEYLTQGRYKSAYSVLGKIYLHEEEVQDVEKAVYWLNKGSEAGSVACDEILAGLFFTVEGLRRKIGSPEKYLQRMLKADAENVQAHYILGSILKDGVLLDGRVLVEKDLNRAIIHLKQAAELGEIKAYDLLGGIYSDADTALYNYAEALKAYKTAATKGDTFAWASLASMHLLPEFRKELMNNPSEGLSAARNFFKNGDGAKGIKEYLVKMILVYTDESGRYSESSKNEYLYLLNNLESMKIKYQTDELQEEFSNILKALCGRIAVIYMNDYSQGLDKVIEMLEKLVRIGDRNPYIKQCIKKTLLQQYVAVAETFLERHELEKAKEYYEQAAWLGSFEAESQLKRFKTNMFGSLKFV